MHYKIKYLPYWINNLITNPINHGLEAICQINILVVGLNTQVLKMMEMVHIILYQSENLLII